ncbi:PfkB family carbohydrate kinase [Pelagibacteraceae bacterium]|nr:PfkB family carbohydrate kinase [Pelagibacteraceae bacterium]
MTKEFFDRYKYKISNIDQIIKILKKNKKLNKKSVMCHGVFDVVHPGHIRHLAYAKSIADVLIVSITEDKAIKKGIDRPHIPSNLRALNLAAFEMVDFVIIDKNITPIENLKKIKPDFYAKGFEYGSKQITEATKEEIKVLKKNKGKIIFTPSDVVYSSTNFLKLSRPDITYEKLLFLMSNKKINFNDLRDSLQGLEKIKVHIIGDTIVDKYTWTSLIGGQVKTPTLSVVKQNEKKYVGGAGIVAKHISSAGAKTVFTTILGDDINKDYVIEDLKKYNVKLNSIVEDNKPTTEKNVIICNNHRLLKIDKLDNKPISNISSAKISNLIKKTKSNAVIFSDFRHGLFNSYTIKYFTDSINKKIFKVADSQVASRWGNICDFKKFDLILPNEREARFSLADQDSTIGNLALKLKSETKYKNLILKLGEKGILACKDDRADSTYSIGSFCKNVIDPVGSGDALLAYSTLVYLNTKSFLISCIIGSIAAACECELDGNHPISPNQIVKKIDEIEKETKFEI